MSFTMMASSLSIGEHSNNDGFSWAWVLIRIFLGYLDQRKRMKKSYGFTENLKNSTKFFNINLRQFA